MHLNPPDLIAFNFSSPNIHPHDYQLQFCRAKVSLLCTYPNLFNCLHIPTLQLILFVTKRIVAAHRLIVFVRRKRNTSFLSKNKVSNDISIPRNPPLALSVSIPREFISNDFSPCCNLLNYLIHS